MFPAGSENIVREVVKAIFRFCEEYCTDDAKTVVIKAGNIRKYTSIRSCAMVGSVLKEIMQMLEKHGLVQIRKTATCYKYIVKCRDLPKLQDRLLQLLA